MRQKTEAGKRTNKGGTFSGKSGLQGGMAISGPTTLPPPPPLGDSGGNITSQGILPLSNTPLALTARRILGAMCVWHCKNQGHMLTHHKISGYESGLLGHLALHEPC